MQNQFYRQNSMYKGFSLYPQKNLALQAISPLRKSQLRLKWELASRFLPISTQQGQRGPDSLPVLPTEKLQDWFLMLNEYTAMHILETEEEVST